MKRVFVVGLSLALVVPVLFQTSCSKKGGKHLFLKMYTSCNMIGSLEPCG